MRMLRETCACSPHARAWGGCIRDCARANDGQYCITLFSVVVRGFARYPCESSWIRRPNSRVYQPLKISHGTSATLISERAYTGLQVGVYSPKFSFYFSQKTKSKQARAKCSSIRLSQIRGHSSQQPLPHMNSIPHDTCWTSLPLSPDLL